ncbi:hypothetical protein H6F98_19540 [Microcoleus sp. FACHB-SPT15]|uniref:hypothetical protein n=1 Tax=Microcoleus sp. FACHB-SPT15 TaxID=2692830 RepID=UPI001785A22B|nr:hypothetical protein [Microcoleus sp. FACHB-SPT15]MBD1807621.1 hypothetical protein [Microcoleus sp. FACHB-SPT15]
MLEAQEKVVESEEIQQSSTEIEQKLPVILGDMKAVLEKNGITGLKVVEFKLVKDEDIQAQLSSNPNRVCCKPFGFTVVCGRC